MDDTLLFIPPCCVDNKLPRAVMEAPQRVLTFYTHGDVTMEKLYRALSHLVVDSHVMVLAMPLVTNETAVFLDLCFERGWITHLVLSTSKDAEQVIKKFLAPYRNKILYVQSQDVTTLTSHMVLYNSTKALIINGPMLDRPQLDFRLVAYNAMFYPSFCLFASYSDWGNPLRNVLFPDAMRHRHTLLEHKIRKLDDVVLDRFIHLEFPPFNFDK